MEAEKAQEDQGGGAPATTTVAVASAAVQGVPWWGGVGHQPVLQSVPSASPTGSSLNMEHPATVIASIGPMGFALPSQQAAALPEGLDVLLRATQAETCCSRERGPVLPFLSCFTLQPLASALDQLLRMAS